jgi:hypothetical protein
LPGEALAAEADIVGHIRIVSQPLPWILTSVRTEGQQNGLERSCVCIPRRRIPLLTACRGSETDRDPPGLTSPTKVSSRERQKRRQSPIWNRMPA